MPCTYFPVAVLQNGIKLTNEAPKGIKANIIGSLSQLTEEKLNGCKRDAEYRTLLYSVCFFHAVIQERRKFGPLGWNIRYEFNESDFETATTIMKGMLNEDSDEIVWKALQQVTGDIVYGGRVTDDIDRRTLMSILSTFLDEDVITEGYKYSQSGVYTPVQPGEISLEALLKKAKNLPDVDNPEIFGMNDNADIAFQLQESLSMIEIILSVQPRTSGSGPSGKNPD
jgi:dynein heavy chain